MKSVLTKKLEHLIIEFIADHFVVNDNRVENGDVTHRQGHCKVSEETNGIEQFRIVIVFNQLIVRTRIVSPNCNDHQ